MSFDKMSAKAAIRKWVRGDQTSSIPDDSNFYYLSAEDVCETAKVFEDECGNTSILADASRSNDDFELFFLLDRFCLMARAVRLNSCEVLRLSYYYGGIERVKKIMEKFDDLGAADLSANECEIFRAAAAAGDLPGVKWVIERAAMLPAEARSVDNWALRYAAAAGELDMVTLLVNKFALTLGDVVEPVGADPPALSIACYNGCTNVVLWLVHEFGVTAKDVRAHDCDALISALTSCNVQTAEILFDMLDLTLQDAQAQNRVAMHDLIEAQCVRGVKWLLKLGWMLSDEEIAFAREEGLTL